MQRYTGVVQAGMKRGLALGFPTANIPVDDSTISGIYVARVMYQKVNYDAAVYVDQARGVLEAHLLDFKGDLYGATITVGLLEKIREGAHFTDDTTLKAAIADDIACVREYFISQK